jgi:tRNA(fMet)-specific endonuclease VapC
MKLYMLDTNTVSHLIKGNIKAKEQLASKPISSVCISSITKAELIFGLCKRPTAVNLHEIVSQFLRAVQILPWQSSTAEKYGATRVELENQGIVLSPLDLLIASHALEVTAILVTNDKAFSRIKGLKIEDWTK